MKSKEWYRSAHHLGKQRSRLYNRTCSWRKQMTSFGLSGAHRTIPWNHPALRADEWSHMVKADSSHAQWSHFLSGLPWPPVSDTAAIHAWHWPQAVSVPEFLTGEGTINQRSFHRFLLEDITDKNPYKMENGDAWAPAGRESPERRQLVETSKHYIQDSQRDSFLILSCPLAI